MTLVLFLVTSSTGTTDLILPDLSKRNVSNQSNEFAGSLFTLKRDIPFKPTALKSNSLRMPVAPSSAYSKAQLPSTNTPERENLPLSKSPMTRLLNNDSYSSSTTSAFYRPGSGLGSTSHFRNLAISPSPLNSMTVDQDLAPRNSNQTGLLSGIRPLPNPMALTQRPSSIINHHESKSFIETVEFS